MKRIALFVLTNLAIMAVLVLFLTVLSSVFGINFNLGGQTLNVGSLAIFSLVVGFTGAFISLLLSKPMAKWSTGAQVISQPSNAMESWLVGAVRDMRKKRASACRKSPFSKASRTRLRPVRSKTARWLRCRPDCFSR